MSVVLQNQYQLVVPENSAAGQAYKLDYVKPIRFQVIIKTADETEILHNYDPWAVKGSAGIMLEKVQFTQGLLSSGEFTIAFNDSRDRVVDPRRVDVGCVVIIRGGKTHDSMVTMFQGITFGRARDRYGPRGVRYELTGLGFGSILTHTYVNFQKNAPPLWDKEKDNPLVNLQKAYDLSDVRFLSHNLMRELFEDPKVRPFGGGSLKTAGNFSLDGIMDEVMDFIPNNYYPLVVVSEILKTWSEMTGAFVTVDMESRQINWFYPGKLISGHIVKSTFVDNGQNPGQWTSFSNGPFKTFDSIFSDSGFANRLIARAEKTDLTSGSQVARQATSLYNKDLSQYLPRLENAFLTNTTCIMSKTGAGTDVSDPTKRFLHGALVEDVDLGEGNHAPIGQLVATFRVDIKDIEVTPTALQRLNMVQVAPSVSISKPHWMIWFERGSGDALSESAGVAQDNTVYWWHNDDYKTPGQWSGIRPLKYPEGRSDKDRFSNVGWRVRNPGPTYATGFFTSQTVLCEMTDPASIKRWTPGRPIESLVPTIPGASIRTMQLYLAHLIRYTARKRRQFTFTTVSIPNRLFKLGASVQIQDPYSVDLSKAHNTMAQIQEISYNADVYEDAIGTRFCNILPMQYISASAELY